MHSSSEEKENSGVKNGPSAGEVTDGVARGRGRVRRATFTDLDAILDINDNIYDGLDYMPVLFYIFMQSKHYAMYVCELDGQLVALCNFYFVPETEDLVTIMSLRVRPSFQGQGFGRPEKNPITDQFRRDYPQVTRYIIQTHLRPNIQAKIHLFKLLYRSNILQLRLTDRLHLGRLSNLHQHANPRTKPVTLSYTEGNDWLNRSDKLVNFLSRYAEDYIAAGTKWIPLKINATELRKLFTSNNVFVSFAGTNGNPGDGKTIQMPATGEDITSVGEDMEIAGFSSSGVFQCKYGLRVEIHFYGDSETDLLSHVYSHMLHYVSVTQDDVRIALSVHFPLTIDSTSVRERLMEDSRDSFLSDSYLRVDQGVHYMAPLGP